MNPPVKFPSIKSVAHDLRIIAKEATGYDIEAESPDETPSVDVRLQVYPDGTWAIRSGLSDYDLDHHGFWGCASVPADGSRFDSRALAVDLLNQAKDDHAQG